MTKRKKIMFVFGTRPEAIKMAPPILEMQKYPKVFEPIVVVTGQHRQMLDQVLRVFDIKPQEDLEIMQENQSLSDILTRSLCGLEKVIIKNKPDLLLVQGDTSTVLAAGLAAYYHKIALGHVEAGLRTFDKFRPYPEEINRKLVSAMADLNFAPTQTSVKNLLAEGVAKDSIYLTGNTVIDALLATAQREFDITKTGVKLNPQKKMILVTTHRRENWGPPLVNICQAIADLAKRHAEQVEFVIPVHKNPKVRTTLYESLAKLENVALVEPLDYEPFVHLMKKAYIILTDSGGVQEEAPSLGKPVLVLREKTERPEAVAFGTVKLVGTDKKLIIDEAEKLLCNRTQYAKMSKALNPYGDGHAAERIVQSILFYFGETKHRPKEFESLEICAN
ncbi:MAG: UDP-N-acetylglucosamine 2-epimerase (non-hydrolyzing) [Candidatus Saganbacteria bacterium]|nr:UDP-N-acetylglucosamine 2-epimerase (non-hydrolyzing) [Candidatus Saganbacteria bacterium]